ncbi:class I SAM-dependent methyltransferase [Chloroflexota bacterium]
MELKTYFNDRADIWDQNVAEKDTGKLQSMVERLGLEAGWKVLDVGTGTGVFLPYILGAISDSGSIVGLDIAEEMLKKAQEKNFSNNIEYLNADIVDVPLDDETFNCVICYSSFPHFRDKQKALREINRVMKNGGRLLVCHTSSRDHINGIHSQFPEVKDDLLPDGDEMRSLLLTAGFGEIKIEDDSESYLACATKQ